jgi:hypothetical protein
MIDLDEQRDVTWEAAHPTKPVERRTGTYKRAAPPQRTSGQPVQLKNAVDRERFARVVLLSMDEAPRAVSARTWKLIGLGVGVVALIVLTIQ